MRRLPDFLIIGAMKAATSTLFRRLASHPDIFMPALKEPDFFIAEKNWPRGLDWYSALFDQAAKDQRVGEASTSYSKVTEFPGVAERVHETVPSCRILYSLRDPLTRIRSMYQHLVIMGTEHRPIDVAVIEDHRYVDASRYALQLQEWLRFFPRSAVHIVIAERLGTAPTAVMQDCLNFLELDPSQLPADEGDRYVTAQRRVETGVVRRLRRSRGVAALSRAVPPRMLGAIYRVTTKEVAPASLSAATCDRLKEELASDMQRLTELIGPVPEWKWP